MKNPSQVGEGARASLIDRLRQIIFRPSKASAEPVSRTDDPGRLIGHAPNGSVWPDGFVPISIDRDELQRREAVARAGAPARQHPLAPELSPPPLDWDRWSWMQRETYRRGWSFARYAVKSPPPESRMACVFGIVRGAFGICTMDFYICGSGHFDTLNAVTHLPSGMGCGLFTDQDSAAAACEIAARVSDDWETLDPYADARVTGNALDRVHAAWAAAGLTRCATHAHATADPQSAPIPIWFQDYNTVVAGRPEGKLS